MTSRPDPADSKPDLSIVYHGVISKERIPANVISAIARVDGISLTVIGYETAGSVGYADGLRQLARDLDVGERVTIGGPLSPSELLSEGSRHDVGLVWVPLRSPYINLATAVGSSRKVFDYMACGLALVVPETTDWENFIVAAGYGLACNFDDVSELTRVFTVLRDDRGLTARLGAAGRRQILEGWNYETQFAPVWNLLQHESPGPVA